MIIDTKKIREDFADPRWGFITSEPREILYKPRVVWQVDLHSEKGIADYELGLNYIYEQRGDPDGRAGVVVLFDEAKHSAPTEPSKLVGRMVFSGMGRGVATWALSQTRYGVYPNIFSDAIHVIAFRVQSGRDRAVLEGDIGVPCDVLRRLPDHAFMYWRQGMTAWQGPHEFRP